MEHKKKEMTKQLANEKKEIQKMLLLQTMVKTVTTNMDMDIKKEISSNRSSTDEMEKMIKPD